jgi:hypothetical protein
MSRHKVVGIVEVSVAVHRARNGTLSASSKHLAVTLDEFGNMDIHVPINPTQAQTALVSSLDKAFSLTKRNSNPPQKKA